MTDQWGGQRGYLEAFVGASDDAMLGTDVDGIIRLCNTTAEIVFGYSAAELVGQSVHLLIPPERRPEEEAVLAGVLKGDRAARLETVRITKGRHRTDVVLTMAPARDAAGTVVGVTHIARELRAAQQSRLQAYLAAIVESSDDAILSKDLDGIVTSCNSATARIFGYSPTELIGQSIRILIPPERQSEEDAILAQLRRGERIDHFETVRVAKDGRLVDVSLSVSPVRDASGAIVGVAKIARDITERKRVAAELALQQEWFRVTLGSIGDAVIASDAAGNVTYMNSTAEALTGWPLADAANHPLAEVFHIVNEKTRQPVENPVAMVMRSGDVVGLANHTLLIARDGTERPIADSGAPIRDGEGRILGVVLVFRDATEQRRAEEAIAEQREWLETTLESIGDAVIATDVRGHVVFMNPIAEHLTGWRGADAQGRPCTDVFDIINEYTRRAVENPVTRVLAEGAVVGLANHTLLIAADGSERPIDDSGAPIRNHDGRIVGVVLVFRDVTERRRAELERHAAATERERLLDAERVARTEAERASRVKDEFVAMVSHELRTPLNAILGWTQLIAQHRHDSAAVDRGLDVIARNTRLQAQLISDLLDISRIVSGKLRLDVESVALASVARDAIETVQHEAAAKGIDIQATLEEGGGLVAGDHARLQQVVWNLLSNAIKFTPRGGRVDLTLRNVNAHAELMVADTGAGIKAEFLPHIFDRFHQADRSITRRFGGLGLGLSIVKHLVELHGGTAHVDSAGEGKGATFTIRLPTSDVVTTPDAPLSTGNGAKASEDLRLDGVRVLVVEDDADTREFVTRLLEAHRARVVGAASAAEALAVFATELPDVVVSDIGLPGVDGYDLMEQIRRKSVAEGGGIPAIALTAYARSQDRTRALLVGYQAHVAKPVESTELVATIASVVGLIATRQEGATE